MICAKEEEKALERIELAKATYEEGVRKIQNTMNELSRGMKLFSLLGLHFEKAEGECMKLVFQQIDPSDPTKEFSFLILVDERNMYRLCGETSPRLPLHGQALCGKYLDNLNEDNNIGKFVVLMRQMFCDLHAKKVII